MVCVLEGERPINRRNISSEAAHWIGFSWQFAGVVHETNKKDLDCTATSSGREKTGVKRFLFDMIELLFAALLLQWASVLQIISVKSVIKCSFIHRDQWFPVCGQGLTVACTGVACGAKKSFAKT